MTQFFSLAHITGSLKITQNNFFNDIGTNRSPRTIDQMLFQPYESKEEFISCALHTFTPIATIGLAILQPSIIITTPVLLGCLTAAAFAVSGTAALVDQEQTAATVYRFAMNLVVDICQSIIDLVVLPLTALIMLTRGVSTSLKVTGIYDYDKRADDSQDSLDLPMAPQNGASPA